MLFEGSAVALVTPFDAKGEVNYQVLKRLIDFQISSGTKAIVILGTTGEGSTVTAEEREKIIKFSVCVCGKRVPVIVGCGSNSTRTALELTLQAKALGADGALVVTPYYNKCSQEGAYQHFRFIASRCKFPVIVYNVPSRTGFNLMPKTMLRLSKIPNIVGIKEASGNISQVAELIHILPQSVAVYSGDDLLNLPILALGARGTISVTANCYPNEVANLCYFMEKLDLYNARRTHEFLVEISKALFLDVNPICVKFYMGLIGFSVGEPRLPLTPPSAEIKSKLKGVKEAYEN